MVDAGAGKVGRVALFGGAFDPIHNAHTRVAVAAAECCKLERVLLIPAGRPPHKLQGLDAPYEDRYRMVEIAARQDARFEASRLEMPKQEAPGPETSRETPGQEAAGQETSQRKAPELAAQPEAGPGFSYSLLTVERVRAALPEGCRPYFLIGADAFAEIRTWYRWRDLIRLTGFIVVSRPGAGYEIPEGAEVERLNGLDLPVSSSEIRRKLRAGTFDVDVSPDVLAYIRERGLYSARGSD